MPASNQVCTHRRLHSVSHSVSAACSSRLPPLHHRTTNYKETVHTRTRTDSTRTRTRTRTRTDSTRTHTRNHTITQSRTRTPVFCVVWWHLCWGTVADSGNSTTDARACIAPSTPCRVRRVRHLHLGGGALVVHLCTFD